MPLELQETVIGTAHLFVGFEPTPRYLDTRGRILEQLQTHLELDGWGIEESGALITGPEDRRYVLSADEDHVFVGFSGVDDIEGAAEIGGQFLDAMLAPLGLNEITYNGAGVVLHAAVDSFDECARWLSERLGPSAGEVLDPLGGMSALSEAWWMMDFEHEHVSYRLEAGPMAADASEVEQRLLNPSRLELPPYFLYLALTRRETRELSPDRVIQHCREAFGHTYSMADRLDRTLRAWQ